MQTFYCIYLDPVVQSIVSLMSLLVAKMLTVLVSVISNSQLFLLKIKVKSYSYFFSKNISIYYMLYLTLRKHAYSNI